MHARATLSSRRRRLGASRTPGAGRAPHFRHLLAPPVRLTPSHDRPARRTDGKATFHSSPQSGETSKRETQERSARQGVDGQFQGDKITLFQYSVFSNILSTLFCLSGIAASEPSCAPRSNRDENSAFA